MLLLKFLEEPKPGVYGFLTTENEAKVLPTISFARTNFTVMVNPQDLVAKEAISLGINELDANLLANFYNESRYNLTN